MTFKDVFFMVAPDQQSVRDGLEKIYAKSFDSFREAFAKYKELKKCYGRVSVYRIEDEYEATSFGQNILLNHKFFTLTES